MDKKYLVPAYIRRNKVLNWQLQNKPKTKTWKNSMWLLAIVYIMLGVFFAGFGCLLTKDIPTYVAAATAMCSYGLAALFVTFEVFEITGDEDE